MKLLRILAVCGFAALCSSSAIAATDLRVGINLSNAPPPPVVVVQHPPRTVWLPDSRVYVVNDADFDDDYFQSGGYWYVYRSNYWYRARTWRGPYSVIETRYVPHSVMVVPARHWKRYPRGGPQGQMNRTTYVDHRGNYVERSKGKKGKGRH